MREGEHLSEERKIIMMLPAFVARVKPVSTMAKTGLHKEYQRCANENPNSVNRREFHKLHLLK